MAFPHTHLAGTEIYTRHIRDGKDIGYVFKNDYYNFDFQKTYNLNPFVNFTKVNIKLELTSLLNLLF